VDNTLIIDSWDYAPERSGTISLTDGQPYDIKLEFRELSGNALVKLRWASHSQAKQIIPQSQLFPSTATPTPTSTSTNTPKATATATSTATSTATPFFTPPSGQVWRFYYFAGSQRVAVRVQGDPNPAANGLFYTLGDHPSLSWMPALRSDSHPGEPLRTGLGSTSLACPRCTERQAHWRDGCARGWRMPPAAR
jgi:hypothetical protein